MEGSERITSTVDLNRDFFSIAEVFAANVLVPGSFRRLDDERHPSPVPMLEGWIEWSGIAPNFVTRWEERIERYS
jgi:hypothetical protein